MPADLPGNVLAPGGIGMLAISALAEDHRFLLGIVGPMQWQLWHAGTCQEAAPILQRNTVQIVLCDSELPDARWQSVLDALTSAPKPPALIVLSWFADECLWAEVLNLGGYDVLVRPFDPVEVRRVLQLAASGQVAVRAAGRTPLC